VEISAEPPPSYPGAGSIHILGYGMRLDDPELNRTLEKLQDARKDRNPQIIARLTKLGIAIRLEEVEKEASGGQPGRPHIAKLLVKKGIVKTIDDAFDRYLGDGKPAYVDKFRIESSQAIGLINAAGGIPVLAHPSLLELENDQQLEEILREMISLGLKGVEVYFPAHTPEQTRWYAELAKRYGLLMSGGTDFHGDIQPEIQMGVGRGDLRIPFELYEKLIGS
jgi:predicted metal-dependent phosphoesterase TrpH